MWGLEPPTTMDEVPVSMETDSPIEEEEVEGADEDGHQGSSPGGVDAVQGVSGAALHQSAPCSPSCSASDCPPAFKTSRRSSSLPPSSPLALRQNESPSDTAFCPAEHGHPGMHRNTGTGNIKTIAQPSGTCLWVQKSVVKKAIEDGVRTEHRGLASDQLVPDCVDESRRGSERRPQTLSLPSECSKYMEMDVASYVMAQDNVKNGLKNGEVSAKMETRRQNLLLWSVADVASYITAAGFPEQAVAFRTQEIDGKSLLLMQRSDVLTGLSIRLGPALKIYERHVKVLQRTHFLDEEDDL
ncbi:sterile alpha motif domain containing 1a isoform X2 [Esox lucius]|uniref:SAM domain-containing protein n=1 Tax=Esox lucius TaxID=8010 RepID=A0AAY5L055_ESOLU|nr:sterile alpha motif domain containing 1a isoform X2 [Esox lucius]